MAPDHTSYLVEAGIAQVMEPRYPQIRVRTRSRNPLALVAAVREELRRARAGEEEIRRFSRQALTVHEPRRIREVCRSWAVIENLPRRA